MGWLQQRQGSKPGRNPAGALKQLKGKVEPRCSKRSVKGPTTIITKCSEGSLGLTDGRTFLAMSVVKHWNGKLGKPPPGGFAELDLSQPYPENGRSTEYLKKSS